MGLPIAYAQIDTAPEAVGKPVLAILGDRGLEFRRLPLRPGRFVGLLLTLVVLAIFVASLVIAIVNEPSRSVSGSSLTAYLVAIVVALIAWAIAMLSNRDLKIVATDKGITRGERTINWKDIQSVQRGFLFESSIVSRTGEVIAISSLLDGAGLILDISAWAVENKTDVAQTGSIVGTFESVVKRPGAVFEFSFSTLLPFLGRMLLLGAMSTCFIYLAFKASPPANQMLVGVFAIMPTLMTAGYAYILLLGFNSRFDRIVVDDKGVRKLRGNVVAAELLWCDMEREADNAQRLKFPLKSQHAKVTMTSIGLRQSSLIDAVVEYGRTISPVAVK